mmetsp:Transcript_28598/g.98751  ORF Transcript_28598/g.98751 Transcript_28598/m.98751 type:complete len:456 (+) Transcript_28598:656-2023(+)
MAEDGVVVLADGRAQHVRQPAPPHELAHGLHAFVVHLRRRAAGRGQRRRLADDERSSAVADEDAKDDEHALHVVGGHDVAVARRGDGDEGPVHAHHVLVRETDVGVVERPHPRPRVGPVAVDISDEVPEARQDVAALHQPEEQRAELEHGLRHLPGLAQLLQEALHPKHAQHARQADEAEEPEEAQRPRALGSVERLRDAVDGLEERDAGDGGEEVHPEPRAQVVLRDHLGVVHDLVVDDDGGSEIEHDVSGEEHGHHHVRHPPEALRRRAVEARRVVEAQLEGRERQHDEHEGHGHHVPDLAPLRSRVDHVGRQDDLLRRHLLHQLRRAHAEHLGQVRALAHLLDGLHGPLRAHELLHLVPHTRPARQRCVCTRRRIRRRRSAERHAAIRRHRLQAADAAHGVRRSMGSRNIPATAAGAAAAATAISHAAAAAAASVVAAFGSRRRYQPAWRAL